LIFQPGCPCTAVYWAYLCSDFQDSQRSMVAMRIVFLGAVGVLAARRHLMSDMSSAVTDMRRAEAEVEMSTPVVHLKAELQELAQWCAEPTALIQGETNNRVFNGTAAVEAVTDVSAPNWEANVKSMPKEQMPVMLSFLKGMYDKFKTNIAEANRHEQKCKAEYAEYMARWNSKPESYRNDTAMIHVMQYWTKHKEIQHRQYHNALKLSHASMERVKWAMNMMEQAIAGEKPATKDLQRLQDTMPDVEFMQVDVTVAVRRVLGTFARKSLKELGAH